MPGIREVFNHRTGDAHRTALQGHDLEQGIERASWMVEPFRVIGSEQIGGDHHHERGLNSRF